MKKLLDRRMVGYVLGLAVVDHLAGKMIDPTMAINIVMGMFGILVGGNVVQAIKEPKVGQ